MSESEVRRGGCACGAVRYEVSGPLRPVIGCHCETCRRTSGHYVAATAAPWTALRFLAERGLRWFESSAEARRGFCSECGSSLFFHRRVLDTVAIMAGTLDAPTGLEMVEQIFTEEASDYYDVPTRA